MAKGYGDWAANVPKISLLAKEPGPVGAEALYLLSQIDTVLGTQVDAISDLAQLIRNHRQIAQASDVPERLWEVYKERQRLLLEQEKWFDVAALHEGAWHPMVLRAVQDPKALIGVAQAYDKIGLPHRALHLSRDIFGMLMGAGDDDTDMVIQLARLYGKIGLTRDGLKTLDYLRTRKVPAGRRAEVAMLAASLREGSGDVAGTVKELRLAMRDPKYRVEATVWLARMDAEAGRCDQATPVLWANLMSQEGRTRFTDSQPYLALARCLASQGDGVRASQAAKAAAGRSDSPVESRYATYLSAKATGWKDGIAREALSSGEDVWAALSRDKEDQKAFAEELDSYRENDPLAP